MGATASVQLWTWQKLAEHAEAARQPPVVLDAIRKHKLDAATALEMGEEDVARLKPKLEQLDRLKVLDQWCAGNLVDTDYIMGETPLLVAAGLGHVAVMEGLLEGGANIEAMAAGADLPDWAADNDGDGLIDEDPSEWDGSQLKSVGDVDNDGDCWARESFDRDWNGDGIDCNVIYNYDKNGVLVSIDADPNVDEDPNEADFLEESVHRSFLVGFAKFGFIFVLGLFLPMFLATGLIRNEQEAGTLHYLVGKPIARAEILMYRVLGFLGIAWPYFIGLILLCAIVTGFFGPGESVFRFSDLGIWFGILLAVLLAVLVYSVIFVTFGVAGRTTGYIAVFFYATFEFFMLLLGTATSGSSAQMKALTSMSVSF